MNTIHMQGSFHQTFRVHSYVTYTLLTLLAENVNIIYKLYLIQELD